MSGILGTQRPLTREERTPARRAIAIYAGAVALAWLAAYLLRGDNEGLSAGILLVALLPSILLAVPLVMSTTIENSVVASAVLVAAGCANAALLYWIVTARTRRSADAAGPASGETP